MINCHIHSYLDLPLLDGYSLFHIHKLETDSVGFVIRDQVLFEVLKYKTTNIMDLQLETREWGDSACDYCQYKFICATNE